MRTTSPPIRLIAAEHGEPRVISNGVLGMSLFILTEIMLFAGMISVFNIVRASSIVWPPPNQPRLPVEETAVNTLALLASGVCVYLAQRRFETSRPSARLPLTLALGLGSFFVVFQGYEWISMITQGLTLTSSTLGSFFYLIVGMHALHVVAALGMLFQTWRRHAQGWLQPSQLATTAVFWYFVVGAWPLIYWRVYL
jgi:heme/copper-type cytochrome/quinol oxidase subunit 3